MAPHVRRRMSVLLNKFRRIKLFKCLQGIETQEDYSSTQGVPIAQDTPQDEVQQNSSQIGADSNDRLLVPETGTIGADSHDRLLVPETGTIGADSHDRLLVPETGTIGADSHDRLLVPEAVGTISSDAHDTRVPEDIVECTLSVPESPIAPHAPIGPGSSTGPGASSSTGPGASSSSGPSAPLLSVSLDQCLLAGLSIRNELDRGCTVEIHSGPVSVIILKKLPSDKNVQEGETGQVAAVRCELEALRVELVNQIFERDEDAVKLRRRIKNLEKKGELLLSTLEAAENKIKNYELDAQRMKDEIKTLNEQIRSITLVTQGSVSSSSNAAKAIICAEKGQMYLEPEKKMSKTVAQDAVKENSSQALIASGSELRIGPEAGVASGSELHTGSEEGYYQVKSHISIEQDFITEGKYLESPCILLQAAVCSEAHGTIIGNNCQCNIPVPIEELQPIGSESKLLIRCQQEQGETSLKNMPEGQVKSRISVADGSDSMIYHNDLRPMAESAIGKLVPQALIGSQQEDSDSEIEVRNPTQQGDDLERSTEEPPPGSREQVILYTTAMSVIRKTFDECNQVRLLLHNIGAHFIERDISLGVGYKQELQQLVGSENARLPCLFVKGTLIGGAHEVEQLNEGGNLTDLLREFLVDRETIRTCVACAGHGVIICPRCDGTHKVPGTELNGELRVPCIDCTESGFVRCPFCN